MSDVVVTITLPSGPSVMCTLHGGAGVYEWLRGKVQSAGLAYVEYSVYSPDSGGCEHGYMGPEGNVTVVDGRIVDVYASE